MNVIKYSLFERISLRLAMKFRAKHLFSMRILTVTQSIYVLLINFIAIVSSRIPAILRRALVDMSVAVLLIIGVLKYCSQEIKYITQYHHWSVTTGTVMLAILTVALIDKNKYTVNDNINRLFWAGWIGSFAWMFALSFFHPVEDAYQVWSMLSILLFPVMFIICAQSDRVKELFNLVADRTILVAFAFFIVTLIVVPFLPIVKSASYYGMASNPNHNGMLSTGFYSAALYKLIADKKRPLVYLFLMGMCIALSVASNTRTSILAIILESILALIYLLSRKSNKNTTGKLILQIAIGATIALLTATVSGFLLKTIDKTCFTAEAMTSTSEQEDTFQKLDRISSKRITLWKAYIEKSTFFGNGWSGEPVIDGMRTSRWPHNTAIDILYTSGVPAFIGYIAWCLACLAFIIKSIFERNSFVYEKYYSMIVFTGYFTEAMLEVTIFPMTTGLAFMAMLGLIPVSIKDNRRQTERYIYGDKA